MATVKVRNGAAIFQMEEIVIGSQFRFALQIKNETAVGSGVFTPMNLDGYTVEAHIKDNVKNDVTPDAQFTVTKRIQVGVDIGWVDMIVDGTVTGALLQKDYESSVKVYPTGQPQFGDTVAVLVLPMKFRATR